ncbi:RNA polymerase sigma factor SigJ [Streptomyces sp. WMMC897]|uniref:RNA polymerase sigma factor SigJ n=1 Tax=Streptomyces sp. WMMC897 TaxID=3014782 RepID=UPI0022B6A820|nr:RNA polymerase sigma factor SigJ [Streptomyces sp. WMMC897]MCZ7417832.1 RNA polymerase sigma factor SigJ [Streptomyces sp. WMMC897]
MAELAVFEQERSRLWGVAYRITGSVADADDAVQEAWLRWQAVPEGTAEHPRSYLTTVVSRICYDHLGSAHVRRETYVGSWLPEPVVTEPGADDRVTLDESVGMALLTVLERLSAAERTAFVLHDVFAVPFPEVAEVLGRTPEAVRQLASRARRRVRAEAPGRPVGRAEHRRAVEAFFAAVSEADFGSLLSVLDPDVVWTSDGGGRVLVARLPVVGREKVATFARRISERYDGGSLALVLREVNGAPGVVAVEQATGEPRAVLAFTVRDGRVTTVDAVFNPEKLAHVRVDAG